MGKYKEAWDFAISIIKWGAVVIGGICLLSDIFSTGTFLEDVSLGDGLVLYTVSAAFFIGYAIYWACLTAVGLWLLRWPMHWVLRPMAGKVPHGALGAIPADYSLMWSIPIWVLTAIAVIAFWFLRSQPIALLKCLGIAVFQGFVGGILLLIYSRHRFQGSGISITRDRTDTDVDHRALRRNAAVFIMIGIVFPFLAVPGDVSFVDVAFRAAKIRKDHAVIHVHAPWDSRLVSAGLKGAASFMGSDYERFENVTVRRRSIGSRVVLEVKDQLGGAQFISIPRDHIEVE